jgi:4-hydroxy-2-oxoheptanedioate aldolase
MKTNAILARSREGKKATGCTLMFPSADLVELAGIAGFDFVHLDGEHGTFSPESVDAMCRAADAAGLTVTARVPSHDPSVINLYLDRGVQGIVAPHVETQAEARAIVAACRFGPQGDRSWGAGRATRYNDPRSIADEKGSRLPLMQRANAEMLVVAQLETKKALDDLDAILAVEGIDAFTYGPNDLAQSLGLPGQPDHATVAEAMRRATDRIHARGRKMWSDLTAAVMAHQLFLDASRKFVEANRK